MNSSNKTRLASVRAGQIDGKGNFTGKNTTTTLFHGDASCR